MMEKSIRFSKLRVENLEERTLLAVMAGGQETAVRTIAPTESAIWVVNTLEDPLNWSAADDVVSLREAIGRARTGDAITFDESLAGGTVTLGGSQLVVYNGITIDASSVGGITIDAARQSRVFYVSGGNETNPVELICLTITGGNAADYGGGIYNYKNSTLTLTDSVVLGNTARYSGGGIYSYDNCTLTITDSTVEGNTANSGGGIYNYDNSTLTLTDSTVEGNTARNSGGGICNSYKNSTLTLTNSTVSGNTAYDSGGGIYNYNNSTLTLTNSTVSGNTARNSGGGIYNSYKISTLTLTNSTVSGNTANYGGGIYNYNNSTLILTNSTVSGNTANYFGGGIYNYNNSTLALTNTIVSINYADSSSDLCSDRSFSSSHNIIGLDPGFVTAPIFEEGQLINANELDLSLRPESIAIDRGTNDVVETETDIAGNPRIAAAWREIPTVDIGAYEYQGRVEQEDIPLTVVTTDLDIVDAADGLISLREAILYAAVTDETVTFDDSLAGQTIILNGTHLEIYVGGTIDAGSIGGITVDASGRSRVFSIAGGDETDPVQLIGLTIAGGCADGNSGGGIDIRYGVVKLTDSAVIRNTASSGGGIYNSSGTLTVTNSTISGNSVTGSGGGICSKGSLTLINTIVSLNLAKNSNDLRLFGTLSGSNNIIGLDPGFAVAPIFEDGKLINADELDFSLTAGSIAIDRGTNNAVSTETDLAGHPRVFASWRDPATVDIGAYEYQEHTEQEALSTVVTTNLDILDVTDGLISLREAIFYASSGETVTFDENLAGKTIALNGMQLEIYQVVAIDAESIGGITIDANGKNRVFYINAGNEANPVELTGLVITGGQADSGSGIYNDYGTLTVADSAITRNTADSGGGIYNSSGTLAVADSIVAENNAIYDGGGIYNLGTLTITGSTISGDTADSGGGVYNSSGTLTVTGSAIVGNNASYNGGGIYSHAQSKITGSTVSGNTAGFYGGGAYNSGLRNTLTVMDSVFAENTADYGGGISNDDGGNLMVVSSTFVGNTAISGGGIDNIEYAETTVIESVIAGNTAIGGKFCNGGGISNTSALTVIGSTIAGNIADSGGGIYSNYSGTLSLTNTIVSLNCASDRDDIFSDSEPFTGSNNIVGLDPGFAAAPVFIDGKLVNADELDLSLTEGSAAIDTGLNDAVTTETDIAGNPRIFASWREIPTVDIGAYEYQNKTEEEVETPSTVVTTTLDLFLETDGLISLREAIYYAEPGETVTFDESLAGETITLNGTQLEIDKEITIDASSIGGITIDADGECRVFYIDAGGETIPVELIGLTITGGNAGNRDGGGIYNRYGALKVTGSTVSGNTARSGGGICNSGTLTVSNSVISANTAGNYGDGGGIYNNGGTLTVTGSTISGNSSGPTGYGGGIYNPYGTLTVTNTIVSLNYTKFYGDIHPTDYAGSNNIVDLDPGFVVAPVFVDGKLVNAVELDLSLAEGSIAIDAGLNDAVTAETDIAGNPRIVNGIVDIGAYEYQGTETEQLAVPAILTGSGGLYVSYGANRHQLTWTAVENASGYELQYSADGSRWASVLAADTSAVFTGLTYGQDMKYRVRALGTGSYSDSDWSGIKVFNVCPMDVNNDGDISGTDRVLLISSWLSEEGDDDFLPAADINGDGSISARDRALLTANWLGQAGDDDLVYPEPRAADIVFAEYCSADQKTDLGVFWD